MTRHAEGLRDRTPYRPDLTPFEQPPAKRKALLRKAEARTRKARWTTIGELLATFSPADGRRIEDAGYPFD